MIAEAFGVIREHRLRSFLTVLGLLIGVSAVIVMQAVIAGASEAIERRIRGMGSNLIQVTAKTEEAELLTNLNSGKMLTVADAISIASLEGVARAAPVVAARGQVVYKSTGTSAGIFGTAPAYLAIRHWGVELGVSMNEMDVAAARAVALLGQRTAAELFKTETPLHKTILINGRPFRVVGVLQSKGLASAGDQDDIVIVPIGAYQQRLATGAFRERVSSVEVSARSGELVMPTESVIATLLRTRHRVDPRRGDDFRISDMGMLRTAIAETQRSRSLMLGMIGSISLLVGGIGIMNVMLVSVAERAREIGLRKAIGATRTTIVIQFLVESIAMSMVGCMAGIVVGIVSARLVPSVLDLEMEVTTVSVATAALVCAAVGILFGLYPAYRAAHLDPVEALRYQ